MRDEIWGILPCWVLTEIETVVRILLYRSCHPFSWWPVQPAILSSLFMLFLISISALFAAFTSILSFLSLVSRLSCHSFLFPHPSILSSFSFLTAYNTTSILSSFFDGVPSILSSFSLVTHPVGQPTISFYPFPVTAAVFFIAYNVHRVILLHWCQTHPVILLRWCPVHPVSFFAVTHQPTILSSLFYPFLSLFFVSHLSILSSLFAGEPFHPVIPVCSLIPPSCHPCLLPLASPSCQTV